MNTNEQWTDEYYDSDMEEYEEWLRARENERQKPRGVRNRELGRRGEDAAARYLDLIGYDVLERNWECPAGEADIIAQDEDTIVFVEVKTRSGVSRGFPSEAVDEEKRSRYERIAAWYLKLSSYVDVPIRFDIVALLVISEDRAMIKHYVNAFGVVS